MGFPFRFRNGIFHGKKITGTEILRYLLTITGTKILRDWLTSTGPEIKLTVIQKIDSFYKKNLHLQ